MFGYDNGDTAWTKTGHTDLKKLPEKIRKHAASKKHINCTIDLSHLGQANIAVALNEGHELSIARHNEAVRKNRKVLSKIIDCIKFCGEFELLLRGHDERVDSTNPGVFRGLLDLTSNLDSSFKSHFETATLFKGTSKTIQNEILESILENC